MNAENIVMIIYTTCIRKHMFVMSIFFFRVWQQRLLLDDDAGSLMRRIVTRTRRRRLAKSSFSWSISMDDYVGWWWVLLVRVTCIFLKCLYMLSSLD